MDEYFERLINVIDEDSSDESQNIEKDTCTSEYTDNETINHKVLSSFNEAMILKYCKIHLIGIKDHRAKGGNFWVLYDRDDDSHSLVFKDEGMKYKPGKGWWIKLNKSKDLNVNKLY